MIRRSSSRRVLITGGDDIAPRLRAATRSAGVLDAGADLGRLRPFRRPRERFAA
jgi:hypothetical protein